jgi:hypothetical protein
MRNWQTHGTACQKGLWGFDSPPGTTQPCPGPRVAPLFGPRMHKDAIDPVCDFAKVLQALPRPDFDFGLQGNCASSAVRSIICFGIEVCMVSYRRALVLVVFAGCDLSLEPRLRRWSQWEQNPQRTGNMPVPRAGYSGQAVELGLRPFRLDRCGRIRCTADPLPGASGDQFDGSSCNSNQGTMRVDARRKRAHATEGRSKQADDRDEVRTRSFF